MDMVRKGCEVTVFSIHKPNRDQIDGVLPERTKVRIYYLFENGNRFWKILGFVKSHPLFLLSLLKGWNKTKLWGPLTWKERVKILMFRDFFRSKRISLDVIHSQFGNMGFYAVGLETLGPVQPKKIVTFHGFDLSRFVKERGNHCYDYVFKKMDLFLTTCQFFVDRLIDMGCPRDRIGMYYLSVDCERLIYKMRRPVPGDPVRLATIGRLVEKKGYSTTLMALGNLKRKRPDLVFSYDIIGSGPLEAELRRLVIGQNLSTEVTFHGAKPKEAALEILEKAMIFLLPSVTALDGDVEAMPVTLKEAMAMGLPVLSTYHSGIPELITNGVEGYLSAERDFEGLFQNLERLLENPKDWPRMGSAGRERVEKYFDRRRAAEVLFGYYRSLIDKNTIDPGS